MEIQVLAKLAHADEFRDVTVRETFLGLFEDPQFVETFEEGGRKYKRVLVGFVMEEV